MDTPLIQIRKCSAKSEIHPGAHAGAVVVNATDTTEWSVLLRIGGPHPQTNFFRRGHESRTWWTATFRVCEPGIYTTSVMAIMSFPWPNDDAHGERLHGVPQ